MSVDFTEPTGMARAHSAGGPLGQATLATLRASSLYKVQPWRWRVHDHVAELWIDRDLQPPAGGPTPDGRLVVVSGGMSLDHARIALMAGGNTAGVERLPDPDRPDLLCTLRADEAHRPTPTDIRAYQAMLNPAVRRATAFPTGPVSPARFGELVPPVPDGLHLDLLADRQPRASYAVLSSDADGPAAWLAAGELLSAVLIRADYRAILARPLTTTTELPLARQLLAAQRLAGRRHPLLALRLADAAGPTKPPGPPGPNGPAGADGVRGG
jgi:hypothetical protein